MQTPLYCLKLSCPDKPGIVAAVSGFLFENGANIVESAQFEDHETGYFFMRTGFKPVDNNFDFQLFKRNFEQIALTFGFDYTLRDMADRPRILVLVSTAGHCIADLMYRQAVGDLPGDVVAIAGNHPRDKLETRDLGGIAYHHLPVTRDSRAQQEAQLHALVRETGADLIVLARYMQVLSDDFCKAYPARIINIHHSFLPGFKGAKPYHQAHARGVKLIGATAHYVTADLDEGPIIEQDVERITHADQPVSMVAKGRDIERRVLTRAVTMHCEDRVCLNGTKTVIL